MKRAALAVAATVASACGQDLTRCQPPSSGITLADALDHYKHLSDVCVVRASDARDGTVTYRADAVPYELNAPLFSDYALKERAVWLPPGTHATWSDSDVFDFPVGTILIKTFGFAPDERQPSVGRRLVETRLLVHAADGWIGLPYVWNAAGDDADLAIGGTVVDERFTAPSGMAEEASYLVPQANQCEECHDKLDVEGPIGPKARQLDRTFAYADGSENQISRWTKRGLLVGAPNPSQPPMLPALPQWDDPASGTTEQRARAYLEGNCAHCHNPMGLARTTGLTLWASETDPVKFGVCKPPVAAGPATGGHDWDVVPGAPDDSIMTYRLRSTTPGVLMPLLGRSVVHAEGVALVEQWIAGLPATTCK